MTGPGFVTVTVEVPGGERISVSAQRTVCSQLVVAPWVRITAAGDAAFGGGGFCLVYAPTGRRVASARSAEALCVLAERLAWFGGMVDPALLADPANAGVRCSLESIVQQWRADECPNGRDPVRLAREAEALW